MAHPAGPGIAIAYPLDLPIQCRGKVTMEGGLWTHAWITQPGQHLLPEQHVAMFGYHADAHARVAVEAGATAA